MQNTSLKITPPRRGFRSSAVIALAAASFIGSAANAAVTVTPLVTQDPVSLVYTYSYTISNTGTPFTIAILDIPVGTGAALVENVITPAGFDFIVDGEPVNLVTFFEDTDPGTTATFAPNSVVGGFSFESVLPPLPVTFSALDENGDTYSGITLSPIPEPTAPALFCAASLFAFIRRRRCIA